MVGESPPFWWRAPDWRAAALWPLSLVYGAVAGYRMRKAPRRPVGVPVLCVGNFTVGGSGKTPVTAALADTARAAGLRPGILSRGHGGSVSGPHIVDAAHDLARHVGDEPLLLARHAPVAVSPDRAASAKLLIETGCDFLIMDDGFQSARIAIDLALVVVSAAHGVGNGYVIPAGPLRAPVTEQLRYADALVSMGRGMAADAIVRKAARAGRAVYEAQVRPLNAAGLAGRSFLAFAGIGHPARFFETVAAAGGIVAERRSFPDHHVFQADELRDLQLAAESRDLALITTEKDAARLRGVAPEAFLSRVEVLAIEAVFDLPHAARTVVDQTVAAWRRRVGL